MSAATIMLDPAAHPAECITSRVVIGSSCCFCRMQEDTNAGQQGCVLKPDSCPSSIANFSYLIWFMSAAGW
jgi:hypothetical protein